MAQWLIVQVISLIAGGAPGHVGATAPTDKRLKTLRDAVLDLIPCDSAKKRVPGAWATWYEDAGELRFPDGSVIQFRSTKKQSGATGSPIQGYTWVASGDDELQDSVENGADPDIEARLRGAEVSYRMCTATAKDSPGWRTFRDSKLSTPDWAIERIPYTETPFVWPAHWDRLRRQISAREWQRRGLAMDVGPERMVYHTWNREQNLRPVPMLGAQDVTAKVLAPWGPRYSLLVGHDPGESCDTSVFLKAYKVPRIDRPFWWVVGELVTERSTSEEHGKALLALLRKQWGLYGLDARGKLLPEAETALIRADPYGDTETKDRPHRSVYTVLRTVGLDVRPAVYSKGGTGGGQVPKEAGIEMVISLLCNADGDRRLYVSCDDSRSPVAPRLVESLELSERDEAYKAETSRKGTKADLSHPTAALRYALWSIERPAMAKVASRA